jgi:acyl-CoA ligase (AMP-forming) (exosortase A-associated)
MQYLVHHMLENSAQRAPDDEALVGGDQRLTYASMAARVACLANGLRELGAGRGDRIAIYLQPSVSLPVAIFGVSQADAVFVPIHHGMFPDQVAHILRDSGARGLITDDRRWKSLAEILPAAPQLEFAVVENMDQDTVDSATSPPAHDLGALCRQSSAAAVGSECIEKDLAAILYTSGSTGHPKGVMLSHANILAGARIVSDYLKIGHRDRLLAALPMSFDAGLNQLTTAVLQGATTVMIEFRFGRDITRDLFDQRITGLAGVPSLWSLLSQPSSGLAKQPLDGLRYITNTGGAMPLNVLEKLRTLLPKTEVFLMYGLTEAFRSTYLPPEELERRPTSMGKAIPNTEILVLHEDGRPCGPGEVGELVHHGPTVSLGYWGHPELTNQVLRPHPFPPPGRAQGDLVCFSGDLVKRDEEGFLYFVGRRDNQIKSSGFRVSPTEVEEVICEVAAVRQAAVVGAPDAVLGQHLVAFAIPEENADVDSAEILVKCAGALPRHMVPKRMEIVSELPMTSSGKVNYPLLRDRCVNQNPQSA